MHDEEIIERLNDCVTMRASSTPPGWLTISRDCVMRDGADEQAVDTWVTEHGGRIRRIQPPPRQGLRAGRVVAPPPGPVAVVYELPRAVLYRPA